MDNFQYSYRIDSQLDAIVRDSGHWSIHGQGGTVLCVAPTIREAIDQATGFTAAGAVVTALAPVPSGNIVVCGEQIVWLRKIIAGREVVPLKYTEAWSDTGDVLREGSHL